MPIKIKRVTDFKYCDSCQTEVELRKFFDIIVSTPITQQSASIRLCEVCINDLRLLLNQTHKAEFPIYGSAIKKDLTFALAKLTDFVEHNY